jgi:hypothetical protein
VSCQAEHWFIDKAVKWALTVVAALKLASTPPKVYGPPGSDAQ